MTWITNISHLILASFWISSAYCRRLLFCPYYCQTGTFYCYLMTIYGSGKSMFYRLWCAVRLLLSISFLLLILRFLGILCCIHVNCFHLVRYLFPYRFSFFISFLFCSLFLLMIFVAFELEYSVRYCTILSSTICSKHFAQDYNSI